MEAIIASMVFWFGASFSLYTLFSCLTAWSSSSGLTRFLEVLVFLVRKQDCKEDQRK
eukprot:m.82078 g.82078  ORF g.82078 m.82078 type:complete len:57 (-) comp21026_c0_seq2:88-258(-)